jgi:farnesol kinase
MSPYAKYMAAFAIAANGLRMIGLGLGLLKNDALVKAISREGDKRELLKGPLYYAISITVATVCFWRNSPVGAAAVANLCAGDGTLNPND